MMRLQAASGRRETHLRRSKSERSAKRAPALKRTHASGSRLGTAKELAPQQALGAQGYRPVRLSLKEAQKLVELGYLSLDSKGDKRAEAIAIEAYLGDSLS